MADLFASGRIVDAILLLVVLEAIALAALGARSARGPGVLRIVTMLLPGAFLLLALRGALVGQSWSAIASWLALALVAHAADVGLRLSSPPAGR